MNSENGTSDGAEKVARPVHLVAFVDSTEIAGAERALGELLASLHEPVRVTVACTNSEVGRWIAAHRESAEVLVVPRLASKADMVNARKLRNSLKRLDATVIHLNKAEVGGLRYVEMVARSVSGLQVVSVVHHVEEPGTVASRWICRLLAKRPGAIVAVGDSLARELETILGLSTGDVIAIPNALGPAAVGAPSVRTEIFTAGALTRMVSHKRVSDLISATSLVENLRLILGGSGPDTEELKTQARSLAEGRVEFAGWVSAERVLDQIDVYLLGSEIEGYPIALLEAQRRGLPVIATNVGGVPEIITHGVDGFLYEPGDVEALAGHLRSLRDDPLLLVKMGQAALRSTAERPGPEAMAKAYADLYWPHGLSIEISESR